jgi:hemerythrin
MEILPPGLRPPFVWPRTPPTGSDAPPGPPLSPWTACARRERFSAAATRGDDVPARVRKLHDEMSSHAGKPAIEAFFGDLFKAISAHFALEERFMRERKYDEFVQHKCDHERLLDEIRDIMDDFSEHEETARDELAKRLESWFARHFETHDARFHKAFGTHPHH